jgi:ribosome biogenesis protein MAK21
MTVLLPDRKLCFLDQYSATIHLLRDDTPGDHVLLYLYFEECVKERYAIFVNLLEQLMLKNYYSIKVNTIQMVYELLTNKTEQESALFSLLINQLCDSNKNIALKTGYFGLLFLAEHPTMSYFAASQIEKFFAGRSLRKRTVYYFVVFLNRLMRIQKHTDHNLAFKLIGIFFNILIQILTTVHVSEGQEKAIIKHNSKRAKQRKLFKKLAVSEKTQWRVTSALLSGIDGSLSSFITGDITSITSQHISLLYRVVHFSSMNTGIHALKILYHLLSSQQAVMDTFFCTLYKILLKESLPRLSKPRMLTSLIFTAVRQKSRKWVLGTFFRRMLQVALESSVLFAFATLEMVSKLPKDLVPHPFPAEIRTLLVKNRCKSRIRMRIPVKTMKNCPWELFLLSKHAYPRVSRVAGILLLGDRKKNRH